MTKKIASVSFGKDSLAMLLKLIETKQYPDEVVFVDTGMEFQAIYDIENIIKQELEILGIKYTKLSLAKPFKYLMFEHIKKSGKVGYSWCGGRCRWGTTYKLQALNKHCKNAIQLVGIAYDEKHRIKKDYQNRHKRYPLVKWAMTEKECLDYCYSRGFYWLENGVRLYDILDRVSCWCCANKNLKELSNYIKYLPEYWERLKYLQTRTERPFKNGKTVFELEEKFIQIGNIRR